MTTVATHCKCPKDFNGRWSYGHSGRETLQPDPGRLDGIQADRQGTGGELLGAELIISPHGENPLHVHPRQEEHFKALSGTLGIQIGGQNRKLREGEEATVPPGTPHRWWNDAEEEEARVLIEFRPALNTETYFETLYGSTRDGRIGAKGPSFLLQHAVTLTGVNKGESTAPRPLFRYRSCSLRHWLRWGGCSGTEATTRSTAERRLQDLKEQVRRH